MSIVLLISSESVKIQPPNGTILKKSKQMYVISLTKQMSIKYF